jgi:hypothetical protein
VIREAALEQVRVRIITADLEDFSDEPAAWPALQMDHHVQGIADVGLDRAKAKVRPDTTMATRESPRAIVLVNACCRTRTAFSQGELAWARAGAARNRAASDATTIRWNRSRQ